jgi:hypothetical protein
MLTKIQRFAQWRGTKALQEQSYLDTALLVSKYVRSVKKLDVIKTEFSNPNSAVYEGLNKHNTRGVGALLNCKLEIEEALEQIPLTGVLERKLLTDLLHNLSEIYNNAFNNLSDKTYRLIESAKKFLMVNAELFLDKERTKALFFDLYAFLNIVNVSLSNLGRTRKIAASAIFNVDKLQQEILLLMQKTENRVAQLDKLIVEQPTLQTPQVAAPKTAQDYFNERFLRVLKKASNRDDDQQCGVLEDTLSAVTHALNRLIVKRNKKEEFSLKIQKIQSFLFEVEKNEKKGAGRQLLLNLIESNQDSFDALINNISDFKKKQILEKIDELDASDAYKKLPLPLQTGVNWIRSIMSITYRYLAPQTLQNSFDKASIDGVCKAKLKDLAEDSLFTLKQKGEENQKEIDRLTHHLSDGVRELEQLLADASVHDLTSLLQANQAANATINEYRRISKTAIDTGLYLNVIQDSHTALSTFIQTHDGFLVQLSNFFANISSIFKSDTAIMIDQAREMKARLEGLELVYQKELSESLSAFKHKSGINQAIKARLQQKVSIVMMKETEIVSSSSPNKEDVRYLMHNLKKIFHMNSDTDLSKQSVLVSEESLVLSPS